MELPPRPGIMAAEPMPLLLLIVSLLILWIVAAVGRSLVDRLCLPADATALENNLVGVALGLGLLAYVTLLLGLSHALYPAAIIVVAIVFAAWGILSGKIATVWRENVR